MKTSKSKSGILAKNETLTVSGNPLEFNVSRARARGGALLAAGIVTAGEAYESADMARARMAARGLFDSPDGRGRLVGPSVKPEGGLSAEDIRAARAGLLLAADVERLAADEAAADEAARGASRQVKRWAAARLAADEAAQSEARIVGNSEAVARLHRLSACAWPGVEVIKGRLTVSPVEAIPSKGSARKINRGKSAAAVFSAADIRARARAILKAGWRGKVAARGARLAKAGGMRWLKRNSRREALAMSEVGAAAGVNDRAAGVEWGRELQSICGAVYQRAAAYAVAIESAPLPPCLAILGGRGKFRSSLVSRGKRAVGSGTLGRAAATWSDGKGRQVEAAEIETIGRGSLWQWAARQSGRDMHAAR